jgi:DNA-binding CsgD family transcriptional regulator/tetratricopeptide (TPR) repeat protein
VEAGSGELVTTVQEAGLVGREDELGGIMATKAAGAAGVVLSGPAGIGKTALAARAAEMFGYAVERVRASRAASGIPLAAFGHLLDLPELPAEITSAALIAQVNRTLTEKAAATGLVLVIDDADLLDDASAVVVGDLAGTPRLFVLLTHRAGTVLSEGLASDGFAKVVVGPLTAHAVRMLAADMLGAPLIEADARSIHSLTVGNPLFVRELLLGAIEGKQLTRSPDGLRLGPKIETHKSLGDVIEARLGRLSSEQRRALELVALAGPTEIDLLDRLIDLDTLVTLEERELIVTEGRGAKATARLSHPLHVEHFRARLTPLRTRQICSALLDALALHTGTRAEDPLRVALWKLERGDDVDAHTLATAMASAHTQLQEHVLDLMGGRLPEQTKRIDALVERFERDDRRNAEGLFRVAKAAWDAEPSVVTGLNLVRLPLTHSMPPADVTALFDQLARLVETDRHRRLLAHEVAGFQLWQGHDLAAALATLDRAVKTLTDRNEQAYLMASRAGYILHSGDPMLARRWTKPIWDDHTLASEPRALSAASLTGACALLGRFEEGLSIIEAATGLALADAQHDYRILGDLMYAKVGTLIGAARYAEAAAVANDVFGLSLEFDSIVGVAQFGVWIGCISLYRGHVKAAIEHLEQMDRLLNHSDDIGVRAQLLANLASAYALAGQTTKARQHLDMARSQQRMKRFFDIDIDIAEAWTTAAEGDRVLGAKLAMAAAERARESESMAYATNAATIAARLGSPQAGGLLKRIATTSEGPLASLALEALAAKRDHDAQRLDDLTGRYAELLLDLHAAECSAAASTEWRNKDENERALASLQLAREFLARCDGARPPTLERDAEPHTRLTRREREIAQLAARGDATAAIAEQLFLSTRTVESHLYKVFTKLGVTRRSELSVALG